MFVIGEFVAERHLPILRSRLLQLLVLIELILINLYLSIVIVVIRRPHIVVRNIGHSDVE